MNKKDLLLFSAEQLRQLKQDPAGIFRQFNDLNLTLQCAVIDSHIPAADRNTELGIEVETILIKIFVQVNPVIVITNSPTGFNCRVSEPFVQPVRDALHDAITGL